MAHPSGWDIKYTFSLYYYTSTFLACSLAPLSRIELESRNSSTSTQRLLRQQLDDGVELGRGLLEVRERALVVPRRDVRAAAVAFREHRELHEVLRVFVPV